MTTKSLQPKASGAFTFTALSQDDRPKNSDLRRVRYFALVSRIIVIVLQVIFNNVIPDHVPDVFSPAPLSPVTVGDGIVSRLFGGFRRWDSIYFLFIAEHGYPYENCLAFFPLYPLLVRIFGYVVSLVTFRALSIHSSLLLSGVSLNVIFFVFAAESLYKWCTIVGDGRFRAWAFNAALLFSFNPASVFFSSCYSESLFACLTFSGLWHLESSLTLPKKAAGKVQALFYFALSGAVRSNGIVNLGYSAYQQLRELFYGPRRISFVIRKIIQSILFIAVGLLPFLLFQLYAFRLYCHTYDKELPDATVDYATLREYVVLHKNRTISEWCTRSLPLSYSYIQEQHWNVGFFRYYEWKQIPNFVLAAPILTIGLWSLRAVMRPAGAIEKVFPYIAHLGFLLVVNTFFLHVQISTRMICSATPIVYCCLARLFLPLRSQHIVHLYYEMKRTTKSFFQKAVVIYFVSFCVFGLIFHSNFLPWT